MVETIYLEYTKGQDAGYYFKGEVDDFLSDFISSVVISDDNH